jgi:hypothetical protein
MAAMQGEHRGRLLEIGAASRLAVERLADVLPLEDDRVFGVGRRWRPLIPAVPLLIGHGKG